MHRRLQRRYWLELVMAAAGAVLSILTLARPDWIEAVFDADPDNGSGEFEWLIAAAPMVVLIVSGGLALREWRRAVAAD